MRKHILLLVLLCSTLVARAQLSTSVTTAGFCQGTATPVTVAFTDATTIYQVGNVFTAQLSDAAGSFAAPIVVGNLASVAGTGSIAAVIPASVPVGTGYRIRVVASDPGITGTDNGADIAVFSTPQISVSPAYTGACLGQPVNLTASGGATYSWVPAPGLATPATGAVATVSPAAPTSYTVFGQSANGCEASATAVVNPAAFQLLFHETFGQVMFTTPIAVAASNNQLDNNQFCVLGTAQLRSTVPSVGYPGASGNAYVYFGPVTANFTPTFQIGGCTNAGINTLGLNNLVLSFGIYKNSAASTGSEFVVEATTDGGQTFSPISFPALAPGIGWQFVSSTSPIPAVENLGIRFRQTSSSIQFQIDDLALQNTWPGPTITAGGALNICAGGSVNLTASGAGGSLWGTSNYSWSNGATTQIITVTQPGTYTVSVSDANNCTATSSPAVVTTTATTAGIASNNSPICQGQTLQLSATGSVGAQFSWIGPNAFSSNQQFPQIPSVTAAYSGVYTLYTLEPGCGFLTDTTLALINLPVSAPAVTPSAACTGQNLNLSTQNYGPSTTYSWTGPNGFASTVPSPVIPNVSPASSGVYTVSISNNCGSGTATATVTVFPTPATPQPGNNGPICVGQTLQLSAGSSVPGVSYTWVGPMGYTSNTPNPNLSFYPAGTHTVSLQITDNNGCPSAPGITTVQILPTALPVSIQSNLPVCPGNAVQLTAVSTGSVSFSWTGPGNFTATGNLATISNLQPANYGTYTVSTGSGSCLSTSTIAIGNPAGPILSTNSPVCTGYTIQLSAAAVAGAIGYSWSGPNQFTSTVQNPVIASAGPAQAGQYWAWAILPACTTSASVVQVNVLPAPAPIGATNNSPLTQGATLHLSASGPAGNYNWTGPNGYTANGKFPYRQNIQPAQAGNYTVTRTSGSCPSVLAVTTVVVNPLNQISGVVFNDVNNNGLQDAGELPLSQVMVMLQPGTLGALTNSQGEFTAFVPAGTYTLAPALSFFQTVQPVSHQVTLQGTGQVAAGNNFGIYTQTVNNLSVAISQVFNASPGFITYHSITVTNYGSTPMSGTIRYKPDPLLPAPGSWTSAGYTLAADTLVWTFNNLQPNAITQRAVYIQVPVGTALGTLLSSTAVVTPISGDIAPANNTFTLTQTVVGSWDPNDKLVQPAGPVTPAQVAAAQDLVYTIRFQNTGTAPAVNILLVDTLSTLLNLSTFQMISSSHNYNLTLQENGILEWHFPNIMLPDSNANEPLSHGFVQYRIKPRTTVQLGDTIENTAHIFFDFNEAVVTNTTSTVVALPNGFAEAKAEQLLLVFPNPNSGNATLRFTSANRGEIQVSVLNLLGQEVLQLKRTTAAGEVEIAVDLQNQPAGIYLLQVRQGEKMYLAKVIRQ